MLDVNAILWHTLRTMTEIKYTQKGTAWAVEIQGDNHQEIKQRFYSFWNHGATDGEFHWFNEFRGYFWTDEERFLKSLQNIFLFKLLQDMDNQGEAALVACKGLKGGLMPRAKELAQQLFDSMESSEYFGKFSDCLDMQYDWRSPNESVEVTPAMREEGRWNGKIDHWN